MELTYKDLTKKDVINVTDGRCLGRVTDIKLVFPEGRLIGIFVPGRRTCKLFRLFDKTEIYIEDRKIVKIGGDVILVDIRCSEDYPPPKKPQKRPPCPPPCKPQPRNDDNRGISAAEFASNFDDNDY